ncbi:15956_t:CDS:2, partial [Entrophospora sp. SA101]
KFIDDIINVLEEPIYKSLENLETSISFEFSKDNKICISDLETGVNINNCYKGLRILSDNIEKELEKKFPGIKFMNYNYNNYRQLRITLNYDFYQVLLISQKKLEFDYFQIPYPNQRLYEIDDDEVYSHSRTLKLKFATVIKNFRERESSNHQRETKDIDERVTLNVGGIKVCVYLTSNNNGFYNVN